MYSTCHSRIDRLKICPIMNGYLQMIARVYEVVHIWPDKTFIETQVRIDLLLCIVNGITILFF